MPIYIETIIQRWFNDEKNLKILNGIVNHWSDRQIAREHNVRVDKVANYKKELKKKGLLTVGFFTIDHEKLGLVRVMDFPKELPSLDEVFLIRLARISRPFGYLRIRLLPPDLVEDGYQLGPTLDVKNDLSTPIVKGNLSTQFEKIFGREELCFYEKENKKKNGKVDLLSIYICKEVEKENYGARILAREISRQISKDKLGVQPSISNVNRRLRQLKKDGIICKANPLNLVPLRPYFNVDAALVKKNHNYHKTLAALAKLNVMIRVNDILNEPDKAYISLQYYYSQKWEILGILKKYLEEITFFDHAPFGIRRTIPYEYFTEIFSEKKWI